MQLFSFYFCFQSQRALHRPSCPPPSTPVLPYMTINVTSLKGCSPPLPTLLVLQSLSLTSILSPEIFPFHSLPLILVLGIRWWGVGEQRTGSSREEDSWGISRVLLYQCSAVTGRIEVLVRSTIVLLDEISGGCLLPAAPPAPRQQCWGRWWGLLFVSPHVVVRRPGGQAASSPYAKGNPIPHPRFSSP